MKMSGVERGVSASVEDSFVEKMPAENALHAPQTPDRSVGNADGDADSFEYEHGLAHEDEFEMLMSLALDERLTPVEAARFEALLAAPADLSDDSRDDSGRAAQWADRWELWQGMDTLLASTPAVTPPRGFSAGVLQQIAWQERRKRLWLGAAIGVAAVLLWGTALLGVVGVIALVSANQSLWLADIIQSLAYWWTGMAGFFVSALRSAGAILATAQGRAVIMVYCVVATGMLGLWWLWLQRTTELDQMEFDNPDSVG